MQVIIQLELELLGFLPSEALVGKVAVFGRLGVNGVREVELLHDNTRAKVKVIKDDVNELIRALVGGAIGLNKEGEGLCHTDGVRQLHESATRQFGGNEGLCNPTGKVRGRTVDLGVVLSGESTATVGSPASVGVDNDLTASETSVTLRSTNDE